MDFAKTTISPEHMASESIAHSAFGLMSNGSENDTFKMNSHFFKLGRVYSKLLKMANVGEFPWR